MHTKGKVYVGAQNDCLYIIDRQPALNNDYPNHDANVSPIAKIYDNNQELADRIASLWNAADGMPTEEAVKYIEHGREMEEFIRTLAKRGKNSVPKVLAKSLLAKLEKE
jgi:hypothetical protein